MAILCEYLWQGASFAPRLRQPLLFSTLLCVSLPTSATSGIFCTPTYFTLYTLFAPHRQLAIMFSCYSQRTLSLTCTSYSLLLAAHCYFIVHCSRIHAHFPFHVLSLLNASSAICTLVAHLWLVAPLLLYAHYTLIAILFCLTYLDLSAPISFPWSL